MPRCRAHFQGDPCANQLLKSLEDAERAEIVREVIGCLITGRGRVTADDSTLVLTSAETILAQTETVGGAKAKQAGEADC